MSKHFTKRCATSPTGGVARGFLSQLQFRMLAADKHGEVHYLVYGGELSVKNFLEQQGLSYDPELVESYRP